MKRVGLMEERADNLESLVRNGTSACLVGTECGTRHMLFLFSGI